MPKSTKKKKQKAADFSKAKLKLGKGKQLANNATDTSFKSRSIGLPSQSINRDATRSQAEPVTKRRLALDDLLGHAKHYSPNNRKDAVLGLRELFGDHPELINPSLSTLLNGTVKLIGDDDSGVRKSLLQLYAWVLPLTPESNLVPHASLILLHTTSALSHIFPEIRIDAVKFLDVLIEVIPKAFVAGQDRLLDGYLSLLNLRGKVGEKTSGPSNPNLNLSLSSKLVVLRSFAHFLRVVTASRHSPSQNPYEQLPPSIPTWYLEPSFATKEGYHAFVSLLCRLSDNQQTFVWAPSVTDREPGTEEVPPRSFACEPLLQDVPDLGWKFSDLQMDEILDDPKLEEVESGKSVAIEVSKVLQPLLVSIFLDHASSLFAPGNNPAQAMNQDEQVELLWCVGELAKLVFGTVLQPDGSESPALNEIRRDARDRLRQLIARMAVYFPFRTDSLVKKGVKTEQLLQELNVAYCELTSLVVLSDDLGESKGGKARATIENKQALSKQVELVGEWIAQALRGEIVTAAYPMGQQLSAQAYCALLPTVWSLLNTKDSGGDETDSSGIWAAVLAHLQRSSNSSMVKKYAIEFVGRVVLLQTDLQYRGFCRLNISESADLTLSLPRILWELNTHNLECTELVIMLLLRLVQRGRLSAPNLVEMSSRLVPLFLVTHPTKGNIPGPFTRWPAGQKMTLGKLAIDVVSSIIRLCPLGECDHLALAVNSALCHYPHDGVAAYWQQIQSL